MKIGILAAGHIVPDMARITGDYPGMYKRMLAPFGFAFAEWFVVDDDFPGSVTACDGWLITGSRHGVYDGFSWIARLEDFVRDSIAAKVPVVGICFGHQLIAQAMGGRVEKFAGGWRNGLTAYDFGGDAMELNAWHQDQVLEAPANAQVIASAPGCAVAGLAYDNALSVQPHPEFTEVEMRALVEVRGPGIVPDDVLAKAAKTLDAPNDNAKMAGRIAQFFKDHHHD